MAQFTIKVEFQVEAEDEMDAAEKSRDFLKTGNVEVNVQDQDGNDQGTFALKDLWHI